MVQRFTRGCSSRWPPSAQLPPTSLFCFPGIDPAMDVAHLGMRPPEQGSARRRRRGKWMGGGQEDVVGHNSMEGVSGSQTLSGWTGVRA